MRQTGCNKQLDQAMGQVGNLAIALVLASVFQIAAESHAAEPEEIAKEENQPEKPTSEHSFYEYLSLERQLDLQTTTATKGKAVSQREAPGVMTVVTREEILRSGARDLVDVLQLVPGFAFNLDNYSSIGPGFRGLWGTEGKVKVLFDGHDTGDLTYLMPHFGNRFPIDQIERVEIIRGPGSVMYGGAAELSVINIVTQGAQSINGVSATAVYGQMFHGALEENQSLWDTFGRRNLSLAYGQVFPQLDELSVRLGVFAGQSSLSDRTYTDFWGMSYNLARNAARDPLLANLEVKYRGATLRYLFEYYRLTMLDAYDAIVLDENGEVLSPPIPVTFLTSSLDLSYEWSITPDIRLTPRLRYILQRPWISNEERLKKLEEQDLYIYWDSTIHRVQGELSLNWDITDWLNLLVAGEYTFDQAHDSFGYVDPDDPENTLYDIGYHNLAAYVSALLNTDYLNASAGARYEHHNRFGSSFVPRGSIQKAFGRFHFKFLASRAFRVPSIQNLAYSPDVDPETTTIFEIELGYKLGDHLYLTVNTFDITIDKPIVYFYNEDTGVEGYDNYNEVGTRGFELELRFKRGQSYATFSYSFYDASDNGKVDSWAVPGRKNVLLGFAPHKFALSAGWELYRDLTLNLSAIFFSSQRYGYYTPSSGGAKVLKDFDPELLVNLYLRYQNLMVEGLFVGLGVYNLLNTHQWFIQPYNGGHAPMSGPSLEVLLKVGYDFDLD